MERFYWSDPVARRVLFILVAVILICTLGGLLWNPPNNGGGWVNFLQGLLVNLVSEAAVIIIALLLLERFADYRREKQWEQARRPALMGLLNCLGDLLQHLHWELIGAGAPEPGDFVQSIKRWATASLYPNEQHASIFIEMESALQQWLSPGYSPSSGRTYGEAIVRFYENMQADFNDLQLVIIPRLIQSSSKQELINSLFAFEHEIRRLGSLVVPFRILNTDAQEKDEPILADQGRAAADVVLKLVTTARNVYCQLCSYFEEDDRRRRMVDETVRLWIWLRKLGISMPKRR